MRKSLDALADGRPDETQNRSGNDDGKSGDDRHGALPGKESEIGRKLYAIESIESNGGDQSNDDAAEDPCLDGRNPHDWLHLDAAELRTDAHGGEKHDPADRARQRGN